MSRCAFLAPALVALTACSSPYSTLDPVGPGAEAIATLWWVMLAGSVVLFLLVMALFALAFLRPAWAENVPPQRWLLLGGLGLPALVLIPLVTYGLFAGERLLPLPGTTPTRIEAHARQWFWTFRYPDHGDLETVGRLHLPAGVPVDISITSEDVIHSLWIPRIAGKLDAIPGHVNTLRLQAGEPGRYEGTCAEFCGIGHVGMRFEVIVHPASEFPTALGQAAERMGSAE